MKTITVKVPEELDAKLTALAARRKESKSALIRMALEQIVVTDGKTIAGSSLDLIRDPVGCAEGPPIFLPTGPISKGMVGEVIKG